MTDTATASTGTGDAGAASVSASDTSSSTPAAAPPAVAAPAAPADSGPAPSGVQTSANTGAPAPSSPAAPAPDAQQPGQQPEQPAQQKQDWREVVAGGNPQLLEHLKRFKHPADVGKAYIEAQRLIRQGQHKQGTPPEGATPEQLAAWRKEAGVPDAPEKYTPQLPPGLVLGTADKPVVDHFAKFAHAENWSEGQFNKVLGWYYQTQDALNMQRQDRDANQHIKAQAELRQAWGQDFTRNQNAMINFRDAHMPQDLQVRVFGGRTADGVMLGNDPQFIHWMASLAMEVNPQYSVVPAGSSDAGRSVNDEIAQIQQMISNNDPLYWKDEKKQARFRDLLEARDSMKKRSAA
jgi:hypothetical protein